MNQEVKRWIDMAEMDYGVAKHLFETYYPKPYEVICYHCQQSVEKIIKGIIILCGQNSIPKSHDLSFLMNQIKKQIRIEEKFYDYADELTPYGVAVRYPNELFLEECHAVKALEMSKEILDWGKSIVDFNSEV